ncbi:hypothetical protein ACWC0C_19715 [Streptomyces sp. NPDC001709]
MVRALENAPPDLVRPVLLAWLTRAHRVREQLLVELRSLYPLLADCSHPVIQALKEAGQWWP